ncbi:unnamed protein product, partial [Brassica oleracea var. botrytis]
AFKKLGVDCANWPEQVHSDLKGAADEEKNIAFVFQPGTYMLSNSCLLPLLSKVYCEKRFARVL